MENLVQGQISLQHRMEMERQAEVSHIRQIIEKSCGDLPSQLGTTADATQLLLYAVATLVVGISRAANLAEMRAAAEPFAPLATSFLSKVETGTVKLAFMAKELDTVIADIETRSTAVAEAIASIGTPATSNLAES
jgi:hypothetical protein